MPSGWPGGSAATSSSLPLPGGSLPAAPYTMGSDAHFGHPGDQRHETDPTADVEKSLSRAEEQAAELEERARKLQDHFRQAKSSMAEIGRLCDDADLSVKRSQQLLNKTANKIHTLNEQYQNLMAESGGQVDRRTKRSGYGAGSEASGASPARGGYLS